MSETVVISNNCPKCSSGASDCSCTIPEIKAYVREHVEEEVAAEESVPVVEGAAAVEEEDDVDKKHEERNEEHKEEREEDASSSSNKAQKTEPAVVAEADEDGDVFDKEEDAAGERTPILPSEELV